MKKAVKFLLIAVALLLVLVVVGFLTIRAFLTPAYLRGMAVKILSEAVQQPVDIGRVNLKFGFKIGIIVSDISVKNPPGFTRGPLVEVKKASLNVKLFPLIRREVAISSIEIDGLKLNVEKNARAQTNVGVFLPKTGARGSGWSLALNAINVKNGNVTFRDAVAASEIQIKDINQHLRFSGRKAAIDGSQTVYLLKSTILPAMVLKVENDIEYDTLIKTLTVDRISCRHAPLELLVSGTVERLEQLNLKAELDLPDAGRLLMMVPAGSRPDKLSGAVKTMATILGTTREPSIDGRCELKDITLRLKGMTKNVENLNGSISFDQNSIKNILIQARLGSSKLDISGSVADFANPLLDIVVKLAGNLKDLEAITPELSSTVMAGNINVKANIKGSPDKPSFYGDFSVSNGNVSGLGLNQPITNLTLKGSLQNDAAKITACSGHIGRSDFAFSGTLTNFKKPAVTVQNTSNVIDLDELLPKPDKNAKPAGLPLTMKGKIRINRLNGMDMEFRNVNSEFSIEDGVISLKNCTANAYDGTVRFDLYYNVRNPEPYRINSRMTSLSAQKVLKRFFKIDKITGTLNGVGNFQGKGFDQRQIISNLDASGNFKLVAGAFKNFAFFTGLLTWLGFKDKNSLGLNDFVCSFKISGGKTRVENWALATSIGNFLTNGTIGLDGRLNLDLTLTLNKKESDLLKKYHADWLLFYNPSGKAVIDMNASGKLLEPKFSLDKKKIQERLKGRIKDEWEEKKKEMEKKLKDLFKGS